MQKNTIATAFAAAISLVVLEGCSDAKDTKKSAMEKCKVVDANGKGLIKAGKADCQSANSSCAGNNKAGDPEAWIMVPSGQCKKINAGDFKGIDPKIVEKIETPSR